MQKALSDFLFGLCFGMGFCVSYALLRFIVGILAGLANECIIAIDAVIYEVFALSRVGAYTVVGRFGKCPHRLRVAAIGDQGLMESVLDSVATCPTRSSAFYGRSSPSPPFAKSLR